MEVQFLTGIQRVVREVVLRLNGTERLDLCLLRAVPEQKTFQVVKMPEFCRHLQNKGDKVGIATALAPEHLEAGAILYEMDAVWGAAFKRSWLYPILAEQGVRIIPFVHDVIPITDPQYCHMDTVVQFMDYLGAVLNYADRIFVSTQATQKAVEQLQARLNARRVPVCVTGLGADFAEEQGQTEAVDPEVRSFVDGKRYVLLVGTLEPRKNHKLLLDAFDRTLFQENLALVFAGRCGWNVEALERRIAGHSQKGRLFEHFQGKNDATIDYLYRHAFLAAYPSFNEGYGLPIVEALSRGTPVLASNCEVLREVGGGACRYASPTDAAEWIREIRRLAGDPVKYDAQRKKAEEFCIPTWERAVERMRTLLLEKAQQTANTAEKVQ